ncbi:hypothetical protein L3X38_011757 [Prunus dulcis]|uniref:Aminotransferase-like plant mobile domain-containing protein n=1 Tax=Prunus dulcis TaxID=3755 RepID=A0AAD4ZFQ4_PRUDU|nr:hypothetical protein L3X38_011757 [Prunus dulcis]
MDPELKSIISHLAKLKKDMAECEQQPEEAYAIKLQAADFPEPLLKSNYDKPNKNFSNWVKTYFSYNGSSSGAPIGSTNGVSYMEHVAFLQIWLRKFLSYSKSSQVTKEVQPLAEALADGQAVALGPTFWPTSRDAFVILFCPNPCHATLLARLSFFNCGTKFTSQS